MTPWWELTKISVKQALFVRAVPLSKPRLNHIRCICFARTYYGFCVHPRVMWALFSLVKWASREKAFGRRCSIKTYRSKKISLSLLLTLLRKTEKSFWVSYNIVCYIFLISAIFSMPKRIEGTVLFEHPVCSKTFALTYIYSRTFRYWTKR